MKKEIVLSGVKATGKPHIGNYFGAIRQFVELQNDYETYIFIPDLHSITSVKEREVLEKNIFETAITYLSCGLDPKKVTLYKQSDVPQVTELTWYFNCLTTMPYLMRAHAYKDAEAKNKDINIGIFNYPVLMAADILLPNADIVPVGKDQEQHIEIARDIAHKFNTAYGETFTAPKALIKEDVAVVPGIDGKKMSKSYGNIISLFATDEEIDSLVAKIPTDSTPIDEPKDISTNTIFKIHAILLNEQQKQDLRLKYETPGLSYKEAKDMLKIDLKKFIAPLREKHEYWKNNPSKVHSILKKGGKKMNKLAEKRMKEIRKKVGVSLY